MKISVSSLLFLFFSFLLPGGSAAQTRQEKILKFRVIQQNTDTTGTTWRSYSFENKKIRIYEKPFPTSNYKEHVYTQHKFDFAAFVKEITKLHPDTLNSVYDNKCVDPGIGRTYIIEFISRKSLKIITVHEYYLGLIDILVKIVNDQLPVSLKIEYIPTTMIQNCN